MKNGNKPAVFNIQCPTDIIPGVKTNTSYSKQEPPAFHHSIGNDCMGTEYWSRQDQKVVNLLHQSGD